MPAAPPWRIRVSGDGEGSDDVRRPAAPRRLEPGERLFFRIADHRDGRRLFDAVLTLERREITGRSLAGVLLRYPGITARIVVQIYWQALKSWLKKTPFHPHPRRRPAV